MESEACAEPSLFGFWSRLRSGFTDHEKLTMTVVMQVFDHLPFEHHCCQVRRSNAECLDLGGKFCWLNYETTPYHTILVRTTDSGQPPLYKDVYLNITLSDVNDQPRNPQLSGYKVRENMRAGTPIGTFTAFDEDTKQTLTYSLVDDDQGRFRLVGNQLQKALPANYETKNSHKITLVVEDDGNPSMSVSCFLALFFF